MRKRILWNICQLCIGGALIGVSYVYVHAHDAEKTNFISGMTILKDKVHYLVTSFGGKASTEDFAQQQGLIRSYKELLTYMEQTHCSLSVSAEEVRAKLTDLEGLTSAQYAAETDVYTKYASQVYRELQMCAQNKE